MIEQLEGRVAVVTGAASGIGLAMVDAFLGEGMSVVLSDLDGSGLDAQVARLSADGGDVFGVVCDCLLYTSPSPRDQRGSRMPSSA